jgi:hypothetical protein
VSHTPSETLASLLDEIRLGYPSTEKLVIELRAQPEFAVFDEKVQSIGDASVVATLPNLANWMVGRAAIIGSGNVVDDLYRYVDTDQIPFRKIMVLAGVRTGASISLSGGLELIPFDVLPYSTWKETVLDHFGKSWVNYRPTAAIQQQFLQPRKQLHAPPLNTSKANEEFQELEDVRLCMTTIGPCAPLWLGSWIQAEEWVPNLANMAHLPERLNAGSYPRLVGEDWRELRSLYERWLDLDETKKTHLRVPLARTNSALRHSDVVNAAIDLGIAIDSVYRSARGYGPVRLRAARFLRQDERERRHVADTFSVLWKMRCDAVHEGKINGGKSVEEVHKVIYEGCCLVSETIGKYIRDGMPDWEAIFLS